MFVPHGTFRDELVDGVIVRLEVRRKEEGKKKSGGNAVRCKAQRKEESLRCKGRQ